MATRRSRLQIKPNIGPKPGRGAPPGGSTKPKHHNSMKPEPPHADQPAKDKTEQVTTPKEKDVPAEYPKESSTDVTPAVSEKCNTSNLSESSVFSDTLIDETKETALLKSVSVEENEDTKSDQKTDARPKFRSRFPKAKPNLAKIGRPDKRKVAQVKSPVACKPDQEPEDQTTTTPKEIEQEWIEVPSLVKESESVQIVDVTEASNKVQHKTITEEHVLSEEDEGVVSKSIEKTVEKAEKSIFDKPLTPILKAEKSIFDKPLTPILKAEKKQLKKPVGGKKKKYLPPVDAPPDRTTMKMIDLIYWNPSSNPMKRKTNQQKVTEVLVTNLTGGTEEENRVDTPGLDLDEDSNALPVPQVKIGPDGNIIVNESSLVVDNKTSDEPMEAEVIEEDESTVNYKSFREKRSKTAWSELETKKFYKALSTVGTDFSLMLNLFPSRTRREIKNKFKKEEKQNRLEVDKAIKNRTNFDMTDFEKFEQEVEEEQRLKEELAKAKKAEKETKNAKKRKARGDDIKENKAVKKRKRKKKKVDLSEEDEEEADAESYRYDEDSPKKPGSHRVKEVVEILMGMSQGRPAAGNERSGQESDLSDADSDAPSEAPSVTSEVSVFVPKIVRANFNRKIKKCNVEEDRTVDNQIMQSDVEPTGDISDLVDNVLPDPWPCKSAQEHTFKTPTVKVDVAGKPPAAMVDVPSVGATPTVPAVSVTPDSNTTGPIGVQHMEIPEGLLPVINTAGGADKVQIVLVHDVDADSGQTVVHVYILPKTAEEFSIGGNTVQLTPTKSQPQQDTLTSQGSTSHQSDVNQSQGNKISNFELKLSEHCSPVSVTTCSSTLPSSPVTPFQRLSSKSVTLAQTAAVSTVKTIPSQQTTSTPLLSSSLLTPGSSSVWSDSPVDGPATPVNLPTPSTTSRVCLFKEDLTKQLDPVDLTVKKEG